MRLTFRGTNTGEIVMPTHIPATGKQVTMTEILIVRFDHGKVVELWSEAEFWLDDKYEGEDYSVFGRKSSGLSG